MAEATRSTRPRKRALPKWTVPAAVLLLALLVGGIVWFATSAEPPAAEETTAESTEETAPAESASSTAATESVEPTPTSGTETGPSFTRFARVRAVRGSAGSWKGDFDFFDIFVEEEATAYASSHGMTVPPNGILYVDESDAIETYPIADDAVVRYCTGGVENLTMVPATVAALKSWTGGDMGAMPDSMTDQWVVTVANGTVNRIDMLAIAD
ncbi:MAG: hypothetical protein EG823_01175 [Actinobacteria bacterium]|nr:hypothetical protein [Actinomycetota bacterium]